MQRRTSCPLHSCRLPQLQQAEGAGPLLVAPIYASLPAAQQLRVFEPAPAGTRKVPAQLLS